MLPSLPARPVSSERRAHILLVDDDPGTIRLLARILGDLATLRFATCGRDALRLSSELPPDLILLDGEMPDMNGFEVCKAMKSDPQLADVPVIFVTAHAGESFEIEGFEAGAADFIRKPVSPKLVLVRVEAQLRFKRMADELRHSAVVDALTGIANRRRLDELVELEWRRARRGGDRLSLVLFDVDHFKGFNDRYGHPAGDACLVKVAEALSRACLRPADLAARYGGEEFAILLPQTPAEGAALVAQRALLNVRKLAIPHEASTAADHVTMSAGVACLVPGVGPESQPSQPTHPLGPETLVEAADRALYAAKKAGRDRALGVAACKEDIAAAPLIALAAPEPDDL